MIVVELFKLILFTLLRTVYSACQKVVWLLNGTHSVLHNAKQPTNYSRSTQVLNIWFKYRFDRLLSKPSSSDYLTTHSGFIHPEHVLKDNITLYDLSPSQAVFIESPTHIDIYDSNVASFVKEGQFIHGRKLYVMPIESFYKLAENVGRPAAPLILLGNTSRCGSTLLSQIMDSTEQIVSMSEPAAFEAVAMACQEKLFTGKELDRYIASGIGMLCKPMKKKPAAYFIKISTPAMSAMDQVKRVFPDTKFLFMYREGLDVAVSLAKISYRLPVLRLMFTLGRIHKVFTRGFYEAVTGMPAKDLSYRIKHQVLFTLIVWVTMCRKYLDLRQEGCPISAVKYEDLVNDPAYTMQQLFNYCDLPETYIEKAVRGMDRDSQRYSTLSRHNLRKYAPGICLPSDMLADAQAFCKLKGIPPVPDTCNLEGTISNRQTNGN